MGAALVSQSRFHDCAAPDDAPYADAYHDVFSVIGARDGVHPVYHPKYLEWETSGLGQPIWILLWTGEERDASRRGPARARTDQRAVGRLVAAFAIYVHAGAAAGPGPRRRHFFQLKISAFCLLHLVLSFPSRDFQPQKRWSPLVKCAWLSYEWAATVAVSN